MHHINKLTVDRIFIEYRHLDQKKKKIEEIRKKERILRKIDLNIIVKQQQQQQKERN